VAHRAARRCLLTSKLDAANRNDRRGAGANPVANLNVQQPVALPTGAKRRSGGRLSLDKPGAERDHNERQQQQAGQDGQIDLSEMGRSHVPHSIALKRRDVRSVLVGPNGATDPRRDQAMEVADDAP